MSLSMITSALHIAGRNPQSLEAWTSDQDRRAGNVARYRKYADGDHDANLTPVMRAMLNINGGEAEDSHRFNDNLCGIILDTMLDRINLIGVKADNEVASQWITELLERVRIDGLQVDAHQGAIRDGNNFLMVYPDPETKAPCFSVEPAYDGSYGMIVMYETTASKTPMLAVKVWQITTTELADTTRVNVYWPDRIERYRGQTASGLTSFTEEGDGAVIGWITPQGKRLEYPVIPWVMPGTREPIGVPVVHFLNRSSAAANDGLSELENVIPLQDALNGTMTSMVATTLLSGFPIRLVVGAEAPAAVVPGLVLNVKVTPVNGVMPALTDAQLNYMNSIRLDQFEVANLAPFIDQANWLKSEMFAVTNTPTDDVAADASGEARKQSEVKLIGKVKRFEVRNGNAWEDAVRLAARVEEAYAGTAPAAFKTLTAQWTSAEVRDDSRYVADMLSQYQAGVIDQKTYLESVKDIYDWTPEQIEQIIQRTEKAKNAAADQINAQDVQAVHDKLAAAANGNGNGMQPQPAMNGASANGNGATT